jgi:hypothetical protein
MPNFLSEALDIYELHFSLRNISEDDKKEISDYSQKEIVNEAIWVLSVFNEGGTCCNESLIGDNGKEEQLDARKQVRQLKAFIKKYS